MKINLKFNITKKLQHLLDVLHDNGGKPRFVGGMVRDTIKKLISSDIDIATTLLPEQLMEILPKNNIKYIDLGSKFGTITAILGDEKAEITTLRIDLECDGRHTKPEFTDSFELDAMRRDFTINALSYCPFEHELYDYTNGYEDLTSGIVRFIGTASERIEEDYLRILRFFRFSDRFAKKYDEASLNACIKARHLLAKLSKERILSELDRMIMSKTAYAVFDEMLRAKILDEIMLGASFDIDLLHKMSSNINLRYAALLQGTKITILLPILKKMRFSKASINEIIGLVKFKQNLGAEIKEQIYSIWLSNIDVMPYIEIALLNKNPNFQELCEIIQKTPPLFPINGDDLLEIGLTGKQVGIALEELKLKWIKSDFKLDKKQLLMGV